ncbi:MAG: Hpt domain-containing protein [Proteobacteria bacterium]|nr:Hpt domain-containing protein [Pseudomonadota bacterium]
MSAKHRVSVDADLSDIMPRFIEIRHEELGQIQEALAQGDAARVTFLGHRLKGSGGAYGLDELTRFGAEIEVFARAGDLKAAAG